MTAYEAYILFLALKRHFTDDKYDFLKYNGKVNASRDAFESRRDKYSFAKLAKKSDPKYFLLANFLNNTDIWIGSLVDDEIHDKIYLDWLRRNQAMEYNFRLELDRLGDDLDALIRTTGDYPALLEAYLWGQISAESIVVLDSILNFLPYWKKHINDTMVFPEYARKLQKYKPFVRFDRIKMKQIMQERWLHNVHST